MPGTGRRRTRRTLKPPLRQAQGRLSPGQAPRAHWLAWVLATWFGAGRSPWAPGTAGTLASLPLLYALGRLFPPWHGWNAGPLLLALLLFYPAILAATAVEDELGRHDPGLVVVDETLGTLLTFAFLPARALAQPQAYLAAFFLFRLLDVWKPGFIGQSQALPRGWGIVMDDVLAGLLGGLLLALAWVWVP